MEIILSIFLLIAYFLTKWYLKIRRRIHLMKRFPNPPTVPVFGNALSFRSLIDVIPKFAEFAELYGNKVTLYIGPFPNALLITDHQLTTHVLLSDKILRKGTEYTFLKRWLGKGLLTSYGDSRWKKHRALINPSFHLQILKGFIGIFQSNANILLKKLEKEVGKPSFDIHPYVIMCSLDVICETAMGAHLQAQNNSDSDYVNSVKLMCNLVYKRGLNPFYRIEFFYKFSDLYRKEKRAVKVLHEYSENVIKQKKEAQTVNINNKSEEKPKMILMDSLLQLNKTFQTFTDVQILDEVNTFLFAGHDTTGTALTFSIFALAEYPTLQAKIVEELDEILGDDKNKCFTLMDIQSMKYLEAFIKEVLRMYPPVTIISRIVEEEFEYDGYTIPEGCNLMIYIYGMHHDSNLFPEPETFNPERFLSDRDEDKNYSGYFPFGFGPRHCIGQKFAMFELKTILATLLRHYEFSRSDPLHSLKLCIEGILVSKNGAFVKLNKRN